jgi:tetratricopeptide (TPR) repeat protein
MKLSFVYFPVRAVVASFAVSLAFVPACFAQAGGTSMNGPQIKEEQQQNDQQLKERQLNQSAPPAAPKIDPQEEADYKAFYNLNPQDADNRIKLGLDFIQKYPMSRYHESVYAGMTQAYYAKQDWNNFYSMADKALAINPDDIPVLVTVGWVIPHVYDQNDPNAAKNLDKAERYEKHVIELSGAIAKPSTMTDDQFLQSKSSVLTEAHSGLGLVYFRRQDSEDSVKELQQATQASANPDPTDLFVLGIGLQSLNRNAEAADAFNRCGQIPGALQDRCKQSADAAKKQAGPSK